MQSHFVAASYIWIRRPWEIFFWTERGNVFRTKDSITPHTLDRERLPYMYWGSVILYDFSGWERLKKLSQDKDKLLKVYMYLVFNAVGIEN